MPISRIKVSNNLRQMMNAVYWSVEDVADILGIEPMEVTNILYKKREVSITESRLLDKAFKKRCNMPDGSKDEKLLRWLSIAFYL